MAVPNRQRVGRHEIVIQADKEGRPDSAPIRPCRLAVGHRLLRCLQHHLGRADVPPESRRRRQESGPALLGSGDGLLSWQLLAPQPFRRQRQFRSSAIRLFLKVSEVELRLKLQATELLSKFWWMKPGSNRRPPVCKADALPAELHAQRGNFH